LRYLKAALRKESARSPDTSEREQASKPDGPISVAPGGPKPSGNSSKIKRRLGRSVDAWGGNPKTAVSSLFVRRQPAGCFYRVDTPGTPQPFTRDAAVH